MDAIISYEYLDENYKIVQDTEVLHKSVFNYRKNNSNEKEPYEAFFDLELYPNNNTLTFLERIKESCDYKYECFLEIYEFIKCKDILFLNLDKY